jgi:hypothetical protein
MAVITIQTSQWGYFTIDTENTFFRTQWCYIHYWGA